MLNTVKNTELGRLLERRRELVRAIEFEYSSNAASLRARLNDVTEQIGSQLEHIRLTSETELGNLLEDIKQGPVTIPAADLGAWIGKYNNIEAVRQEWWIALAEHGTS